MTTLNLKVVESPVGVLAFDTLSAVSLPQAQALKKFGFSVAMFYANTVTPESIQACTASGIAVGFTLIGLKDTTVPSAEIGTSNVSGALGRLRGMGVPPGHSLMLDLEGSGHLASDWIAYATAGSLASKALGSPPGAYIGYGLGLSSGEIYALPVFPYWKSISRIFDRNGLLAEPSCGYCMVQQYPDNLTIGGTQIDVDVIGRDYKGRTVMLVTGA